MRWKGNGKIDTIKADVNGRSWAIMAEDGSRAYIGLDRIRARNKGNLVTYSNRFAIDRERKHTKKTLSRHMLSRTALSLIGLIDVSALRTTDADNFRSR